MKNRLLILPPLHKNGEAEIIEPDFFIWILDF